MDVACETARLAKKQPTMAPLDKAFPPCYAKIFGVPGCRRSRISATVLSEAQRPAVTIECEVARNTGASAGAGASIRFVWRRRLEGTHR